MSSCTQPAMYFGRKRCTKGRNFRRQSVRSAISRAGREGVSAKWTTWSELTVGAYAQIVELCIELGLEDQLTQPALGRAAVWVGGEVRPYPPRHVLGVPLDAVVAMILPILTPFNLIKAGINAVLTLIVYKSISNLITPKKKQVKGR